MKTTKSECSAKDRSRCPHHGVGSVLALDDKILERKLIAEAKEKEENAKKRVQIEYDLENNLKPKVLKTGETIVSVFRSGIPSPPKERGVEKESYSDCDKSRPKGHQDRTTAVFASPTIGGVTRWVRGNSLTSIPDVKVRELRVDYDKTYVYSVRAWERYSSFQASDRDPIRVQDSLNAYWDSGIPFRQWVEKLKENPKEYDPGKWELLIPEESIQAVKPVSTKRILLFNSEGHDPKELTQMLK